MRKTLVAAALALLAFAAPALAGSLADLLPGPSESAQWRPDGEPREVEGEDLFLLIDGGAEQYLQAGFRRAIEAVFLDSDGRTINLVVYEMESPEAAGRIFEEKAGEGGERLDLGDRAVFEQYYLSFQKGRYLADLSAYEATPETEAALKFLAALLARKIED
ncbi:MAG: DUF6599 family protein [Thermodesulfobacteriota bacterium]